MSIRIGNTMPRPILNDAPQAREHMVKKFGGDVRGSTVPCPVLSVLLNENLLTPDKDGNVSVDQLKSAFTKLGITPLVQHGLVKGGTSAIEGNSKSQTLNMFKLMGSSLDHKGSLGPLQDGGFNQKHLDQLLSCSKDGKTLTLEDLSTAQQMRMKQEGGGLRDRLIGQAEIAALLLVFGKPNADGKKAVKIEDVVSIFKDNKLPADFAKQDVGALGLVWNMGKMAFMQLTTAAGRAEAGLAKALESPQRLDASAMKGLGAAMCPAGMRPKGGVGVNAQEVGKLHLAMQN